MLLEEVDLELACESFVTYRSDDLNFRSEDFEYDVETHLVVTCACASVSYSLSSKCLYMVEDLEGLEYALRTY